MFIRSRSWPFIKAVSLTKTLMNKGGLYNINMVIVLPIIIWTCNHCLCAVIRDSEREFKYKFQSISDYLSMIPITINETVAMTIFITRICTTALQTIGLRVDGSSLFHLISIFWVYSKWYKSRYVFTWGKIWRFNLEHICENIGDCIQFLGLWVKYFNLNCSPRLKIVNWVFHFDNETNLIYLKVLWMDGVILIYYFYAQSILQEYTFGGLIVHHTCFIWRSENVILAYRNDFSGIIVFQFCWWITYLYLYVIRRLNNLIGASSEKSEYKVNIE